VILVNIKINVNFETIVSISENEPASHIPAITYNSKHPAAQYSTMSRTEPDGLRILAQYERRKSEETFQESLRVDGQGIIPRADPKYCVQITIKDDPKDYRFPIPPEFNKRGYFVIMATELPVTIPYGADVKISIIETNRKGEMILAQSPLRYRTI
jgi:hypothetical protein